VIVNQWVPAAHRGDAVGDHARTMRRLLQQWGHESEIYALTIDQGLEDEVRPWAAGGWRDADITMLHFAVPSPCSTITT
jgi:L-malate glycosyltransferase